jgi:hypothetical protein
MIPQHLFSSRPTIPKKVRNTNKLLVSKPLTSKQAIDEYLREIFPQATAPPHTELQSFDTCSLDLDISTQTAECAKIEISLKFPGPFTHHNPQMIVMLDTEVFKHFSAKLNANDGFSSLVSTAALAGGYLYLFCCCSDSRIRAQVRTLEKDDIVLNDYTEDYLKLSFRRVLLCRIQQLINEVMVAIRFRSDMQSYAAGAVAHVETAFFQASLRNGELSQQVRLFRFTVDLLANSYCALLLDAHWPERTVSKLAVVNRD